MDLDAFKRTLRAETPPTDLSLALQGLWWDAKGNWDKAHDCAQEQDDRDGAWVHAYLHRKEGDSSNADYWYERAARKRVSSSLDEEWAAISRELLKAKR
jgi:hypothetical protein